MKPQNFQQKDREVIEKFIKYRRKIRISNTGSISLGAIGDLASSPSSALSLD